MRLLIFLEGASWDRRYHASALAASATATGDDVELVLLSGALVAWVEEGGWNRLDPDPPLTAERIGAVAFPPLSTLLETARQTGRFRIYGCSASARLLDLDLDRVQDRVDAVLGWQSFASRIAKADRVLNF